jgi:hypothetical protein
MEWGHEEATQESSRRGPRQVRLSRERGQKTGQPRQWPQGRPGQEPQEENCCPAKRPRPAVGKAPEEGMNAAIASIRARFGRRAIGLGYGGIRYLVNALR